MGLFAGGMVIMNYARGNAGIKEKFDSRIDAFRFPWKDLKDNIANIIRSFLIGLGIGFLPGMGASLSNLVAYAVAKNNSKRSDEFGTGVPDGVFAPEVANNASLGGAIIPMIALGIPGDGTTALLLGGLTIFGVESGPLLMKNDPVFAYMIFVAALFGAVFALVFEIIGIRYFPLLLKTPFHYLYPAIMVLCFMGAYINSFNMFTVMAAFVFTLFGMWMNYAGLPSTPFILAFVLGKNLEMNLRKGVTYSRGSFLPFLTRPVSAIFLLVAVLSVAWPFIKPHLAFLNKGALAQVSEQQKKSSSHDNDALD